MNFVNLDDDDVHATCPQKNIRIEYIGPGGAWDEEVGVEEAGVEAVEGVEVNNMRFATTQTSFLGLISATVVSFVLQNRKSQLHEIVNNTPEGQRLLQEKKRDLKRKLVVCLVKIVGLLPWRKRLMKTWCRGNFKCG